MARLKVVPFQNNEAFQKEISNAFALLTPAPFPRPPPGALTGCFAVCG
jgi:hypothetical protein